MRDSSPGIAIFVNLERLRWGKSMEWSSWEPLICAPVVDKEREEGERERTVALIWYRPPSPHYAVTPYKKRINRLCQSIIFPNSNSITILYFRLPLMAFSWESHPLVKKLAEMWIEIDVVVVFWLSQLLQFPFLSRDFEFRENIPFPRGLEQLSQRPPRNCVINLHMQLWFSSENMICHNNGL